MKHTLKTFIFPQSGTEFQPFWHSVFYFHARVRLRIETSPIQIYKAVEGHRSPGSRPSSLLKVMRMKGSISCTYFSPILWRLWSGHFKNFPGKSREREARDERAEMEIWNRSISFLFLVWKSFSAFSIADVARSRPSV